MKVGNIIDPELGKKSGLSPAARNVLTKKVKTEEDWRRWKEKQEEEKTKK